MYCVLFILIHLLQRLTAHLHACKTPPYVVNLDPAVSDLPYPVNIGELQSRDYKHANLSINNIFQDALVSLDPSYFYTIVHDTAA